MENEEKLVTITVVHNGPYIVEGKFKLVDKANKIAFLDVQNAFCSSGHSHSKPY